MKLSDIKERLDQRPFRPFAIETIGGYWIDVDKESSVLISERRPDLVVVFDPNGRLYILGVDQISALEGK